MWGIDEVGRGPWAGPLVLSAVRLSPGIDGLADSKKLSPKRRQELLVQINKDTNEVITEFIYAEELDSLGLAESMRVACERLFSSISKLGYDRIVVDGNLNYLSEHNNTEAVVKADSTVPECMAASIVAKEARDTYMREAEERYPGYGFASHVGYGTKQHMAAIEELGVCDEHRRSFKPIRKFIDNGRPQG